MIRASIRIGLALLVSGCEVWSYHDHAAPDGGPGSTCEDGRAPAPEVCNGQDDDCDGLIDVVPGPHGEAQSLCACATTPQHPKMAMRDTDTKSPGCTTSTCTVTGDAYNMIFCCDKTGAWSQCHFHTVDLAGFDADHDGSGLLEIVFYLSSRVSNLGLAAYYGEYPYRKKLVLLTAAESATGVGPGTIFRYFRNTDAECPRYTRADKVDKTLPATFPDVCLADNLPESWKCKGKWTTANAACKFSYTDVPVYLTAESCGAEVRSSATILSIRHLRPEDQCRCRDDASCGPTGGDCHKEAKIAAPWCGGEPCAGVCSSAGICPGVGTPCTATTSDGMRCESLVTCAGKVAVCTAPASCLR